LNSLDLVGYTTGVDPAKYLPKLKTANLNVQMDLNMWLPTIELPMMTSNFGQHAKYAVTRDGLPGLLVLA